jgi:hypothetical protein
MVRGNLIDANGQASCARREGIIAHFMTPTLTHVADFLVEVGAPIAVGETAQGLRRVVPIVGGVIQGVRLNGTILNAGADYQVIGPDGFTRLEARYVARLDDGSMLYIENSGVRFGPPAVMARMTRGEPVDPAEVYFRTTPRFETAAPPHQWLTRPLFIASGARHPDRVALSVFEVG